MSDRWWIRQEDVTRDMTEIFKRGLGIRSMMRYLVSRTTPLHVQIFSRRLTHNADQERALRGPEDFARFKLFTSNSTQSDSRRAPGLSAPVSHSRIAKLLGFQCTGSSRKKLSFDVSGVDIDRCGLFLLARATTRVSCDQGDRKTDGGGWNCLIR